MKKTQEKQIPTYHLFIDFRQAYDTPNRDELYRAMNHFGIPSKLINLSQMTLQDTWSCVKAAEGVSEQFQTLRGFRQGDALSCSFFNILLEMIMRAAEIDTKNMITNKSTQILGYADDIEVVRITTSSVASVFQRLEKEARTRGLGVKSSRIIGPNLHHCRL
ncbi:reverse transcriptase domain-containing protein [Proteus terrae]|uniref:reverse transcriptase domain-containing protein n=1 Tax=Proteus terrae TaxID=1574161 RepID=UPI003D7D7D08